MFPKRWTHVCTIQEKDTVAQYRGSNSIQQCKLNLKQLILASDINPQSTQVLQTPIAISEERRSHLASGSWIIHPFSIFRLIWETWMALVLFFCLVYQPIDLSYKYILGHSNVVNHMITVLCGCDIIVNFRTGYYVFGHDVEMRPRKIARHYISSYFLVDLLSSLPCYDSSSEMYATTSALLGMLKIARLYTLWTYMDRCLKFFDRERVYLKYITISTLIIHYSACVSYATVLYIDADYRNFMLNNEYRVPNGTTNWSQDFNFFFNLYSRFVYYVTGDLLSVNTFSGKLRWLNMLFTIFLYLFGKLFYAFAIVIFVEIYRRRNCLESKYEEVMSQVDAFMAIHKFPETLQRRVNSLYEYKYQHRYFNERSIEKLMSDKLRREVKLQNLKTLVKNVTFFESLPPVVLENIVSYLKEEIYLPNDIIIASGSIGDRMYFLNSGTVAVTSPEGKEICHLKDGDYFGEICVMLPNRKTTATIQALEICQLYVLKRKAFRKCVELEVGLYRQLQDEAKRRYRTTQMIESRMKRSFQESEAGSS